MFVLHSVQLQEADLRRRELTTAMLLNICGDIMQCPQKTQVEFTEQQPICDANQYPGGFLKSHLEFAEYIERPERCSSCTAHSTCLPNFDKVV